MKKLLFVNQKGGVGKTLSAQSVGAAMYLKGFRVLMVDIDAQGHLTKASGVFPDEEEPTVYEVLSRKADIKDTIRTAPRGYDLLPADIRLTGADIALANVKGRDYILRAALDEVRTDYDYMIIDSPPNLSVLTLMGLTAADGIIIVLKSDYLALDGVAQLCNTISMVRKSLNRNLEIIGVLLTFYDGRTNLSRTIAGQAAEGFPGKVFDTKISLATVLGESPAMHTDIFAYRPKSKVAAQYSALAEEIIVKTQ